MLVEFETPGTKSFSPLGSYSSGIWGMTKAMVSPTGTTKKNAITRLFADGCEKTSLMR